MKCKVLMAALVITLLMGVRGFASPCDPACDPCGACDGCVQSCDLFSGLKKLVNGVRLNDCGPCDGVVACNPCDDFAECDPCGDMNCNDNCLPKVALGQRLRNLFASRNCNPCDEIGDCAPGDVSCDPCADCGDFSCDDSCVAPRFSLRNLFKGSRLGNCETDCNPCDVVAECDPCEVVAECNPCDDLCNTDCDPCGNLCDDGCGPRGHLFDLPRISLKKFFGGFRNCGDDMSCNPCDEVQCNPCDDTCIR